MEHLFFNQLKNAAYCLDEKIQIWHFRTRNGLEVDFVIEFRGKTFLVEIKSTAPSAKELNPLLEARKYFFEDVACFVASKLFYARTKEHREIDFLIERKRCRLS